jgi:hypothetical protein
MENPSSNITNIYEERIKSPNNIGIFETRVKIE